MESKILKFIDTHHYEFDGQQYTSLNELTAKTLLRLFKKKYIYFQKSDTEWILFNKVVGGTMIPKIIGSLEAWFKIYFLPDINEKIKSSNRKKIGSNSSFGTSINTSTTWHNFLTQINKYLTNDLTQDESKYLLSRVGEDYKLIVRFGDRRSGEVKRGVSDIEVTDLSKDSTGFFFRIDTNTTRYQVKVKFRQNSDDEWEVQFTGDTGTSENFTLHGTNAYTAVRGIWFEKI